MLAERLTALVEPVVAGFGYELWGIEQFLQGRKATIKIYIDKAAGVDVEDCARVSRQVSSLIDAHDADAPLPGSYVLEVSSPGMDRRFFTPAQYAAYEGAKVKVRLKRAHEGQRNFIGSLQGLTDGQLGLKGDDAEYRFPLDSIERAQVVPEFQGIRPSGGA